MSDTTKTIQEECYGICWGAQQRIDELTQYLNESNQRIKRLEEAGDRLKDRYILENENWDLQTVNDWNDAKEAKL